MFKPFDIGKYMEGIVADVKPKTVLMKISNKKSGELLGWVEWYGPWRQYCFVRDELVFSPSCLRNLADFIENQTKAHKAFSVDTKSKVVSV